MIYLGNKTYWHSIARLMPNVRIRIFGVQVGRVFIGFIVRQTQEQDDER